MDKCYLIIMLFLKFGGDIYCNQIEISAYSKVAKNLPSIEQPAASTSSDGPIIHRPREGVINPTLFFPTVFNQTEEPKPSGRAIADTRTFPFPLRTENSNANRHSFSKSYNHRQIPSNHRSDSQPQYVYPVYKEAMDRFVPVEGHAVSAKQRKRLNSLKNKKEADRQASDNSPTNAYVPPKDLYAFPPNTNSIYPPPHQIPKQQVPDPNYLPQKAGPSYQGPVNPDYIPPNDASMETAMQTDNAKQEGIGEINVGGDMDDGAGGDDMKDNADADDQKQPPLPENMPPENLPPDNNAQQPQPSPPSLPFPPTPPLAPAGIELDHPPPGHIVGTDDHDHHHHPHIEYGDHDDHFHGPPHFDHHHNHPPYLDHDSHHDHAPYLDHDLHHNHPPYVDHDPHYHDHHFGGLHGIDSYPEIILDHDPHHHHHHPPPLPPPRPPPPAPPTTTPPPPEEPEEPLPEQPRVKKYSYFYLSRSLWYIPLYFTVYFVFYVTWLILQSIGRHKVNLPNHTVVRRSLADLSHKEATEKINKLTQFVLTQIDEFKEKYL